uniref:legumain n=1 Tax=Kalanchoe fedtschenkoi TaxID=63787 RepID=A0A7N0V1K8_KALFE
MAQREVLATIFLILASALLIEAPSHHRFPKPGSHHSRSENGKRWALLVAGSYGYSNYRHQADVCHAYQVLKKGGLKDENIIVFMFDDIASNKQNPRKGVIINRPNGPNVYPGVPKDYTGANVTVGNFFNVILANRSGLTGGSGKVLDSGPDDHIFIYYSDHGAPGFIEMPDGLIFARDFAHILKKKYEARSYAQMVIYMEACFGGSIFKGLLSDNWNIYATTAANPEEQSYVCYCMKQGEYQDTCLGDHYSVSWIEDSERRNLSGETLEKQFKLVRNRTWDSHVMEYGNKSLAARSFLNAFMGAGHLDRSPFSPLDTLESANVSSFPRAKSYRISQHEAELYHHRQQYVRARRGSKERSHAKQKLVAEIRIREETDLRMSQIADALFGSEMGSYNMGKTTGRPEGEALVDDWDCLENMLKAYQERCGKLNTYGLKYTRLLANMCNAGVHVEQMASAAARVCAVG